MANRLRDKNYENLPNPELVSIYHKMEDFEKSGLINRDSEEFQDSLQFLKTNMLNLIDQTKKYVDLPIFDEFYTTYDYDNFRTSQPMMSLC